MHFENVTIFSIFFSFCICQMIDDLWEQLLKVVMHVDLGFDDKYFRVVSWHGEWSCHWKSSGLGKAWHLF